MHSGEQESYTSQNTRDIVQATSTNVSPSDIAPINVLLDEVLLEIFACYVEEYHVMGAWHTLARVCRRWRSIALGSPRRLNLRVFCLERLPVRTKLDSWPPFPIVLRILCPQYWPNFCKDNILVTLERQYRVCEIGIWNISSSLWATAIMPLMQKPFPILTVLNLQYNNGDGTRGPVIPNSFLGGSAPQLRILHLENIPFPGLPNLLLSTTDLVHLKLHEIPDSGYISADTIATCLSTLTRLESFWLCFQSPLPAWERRRTSSSTRTFLPYLSSFEFKGVSEYLEDIVDGIDAPLLDTLRICFFHQPIFDNQRLVQFIGRLPMLKTCNEARINIGAWHASVEVLSISETITKASLLLKDWYLQPVLQLSTLVQFCTSSLPQALIPTVGELRIYGDYFSRSPEQDGINPNLWRELFQPFTAVKDLYLSPDIIPHISLVQQELVGEGVMEFLPVLQNIFLGGLDRDELVPEGIEQFIAARQLAGRPISIHT